MSGPADRLELARRVVRLLAEIVLLLLSPVLLTLLAGWLAACDLAFFLSGFLSGKPQLPPDTAPRNHAASVVIPNWNGRDLLERFLPSVVEATAGCAENEIIVVDNASTDRSVEMLRERFPSVRVLALDRNLGFGGGSNAGFQAANNDIVVLLNNDMRVETGFLAPLLAPFTDPRVFSVSCQIFFTDPHKRREETGLTQMCWQHGQLRVGHRIDTQITSSFPCAYPGGGSSAFDRAKFLSLGGFDRLLEPFYYEDADLGYMAWKRGWLLYYEPRSIVFHEHRGTIGKRFGADYIRGVLRKNELLVCWKNLHDWAMLGSHLVYCFARSAWALCFDDEPRRYSFLGLFRAALQLGGAMRSRWQARARSAIRDREALRRPLGGHFRDTFLAAEEPIPERLNILFVAPYPIEPPVHGGGVFMKQTLEELAPLARVHLAGFLERESDFAAQATLDPLCASAYFQVRQPIVSRKPASLLPRAVREFHDGEMEWALHRIIYQERIDAIQLEYTMLGQYGGEYRHIPSFLFEHDIMFQAFARGDSRRSAASRWKCKIEYLRSLRYEIGLLGRMNRVQMCSESNARYLLDHEPRLAPKLDTHLRAGIRVHSYAFHLAPRVRDTMLFVGSFRHLPNHEALDWFTSEVLPRVVALRPEAKLVIVGSDSPRGLGRLQANRNVVMTGFVPDIREPLSQCAVFVCPILSGSGVRVKLLEAFAAGIPVVSTRLGAEGLVEKTGLVCELADNPERFAAAVVNLLADPGRGERLATEARAAVAQNWDVAVMTRQLEAVYRGEVRRLRG
jgi:O-antigen biosynthesis protein